MTAWQELAQAGIVSGEPPETGDIPSPWYVRAMLGAAGWIAAFFLIGFIYLGIAAAVEEAATRIVVGLVLVAVAGVMLQASHNDFAIQLGLALSFAGQALACWGLVETLHAGRGDEVAAYLAVGGLEAALALAIGHPIHRTWCVFAAAVFLWLAARASGFPGVGRFLLASTMAGLWLGELERLRVRELVAASAWGVTLALVVVEAWHVFDGMALAQFGVAHRLPWRAWVGDALVGLVLVEVARRLCRRPPLALTAGQDAAAVIAAAVVALASLRAPGLAVGLMIVVLGFGNGNRPLLGLGVAGLLAAVSAYYYSLETTLLVKSQLLAALGLVLLGLRLVALRRLGPEEEQARA